jgi:hypothetical protein
MFLREVPIEELKTGDRVLSYRGRPGKILLMSDIGATQHIYIIVWSIEDKWTDEKQFISVDGNVHIRNPEDYPISDNEIRYLGRN